MSIESIDYDAAHNEFVLAVQRTIYVVDENFDLIRTSINYVRDCLDRFGIKIGIQDITAKNGLVYAWTWFNGEGLTTYPICVVVDTIEDEVVNVLNVPDNYIDTEPEGAVKDINDASISYSIIKAPIPGTDVGAINIVEISKKRNVTNSISFAGEPFFADDSYYLAVYVDNSSTKSLEDGSTNFPFKTLGNAIAALRTKSKNIAFFLKKTSIPYVGKFGNVVGKSIRLIGNSGTPNIYVSARFTNASFRAENINFILDKNDAKAGYISEDDDKFAIRLEHSSLYLVAGCYINGNAPQTEDNVTDGIGFCYGVNSSINSNLEKIYNIPFYVMGKAVTINMNIGSLINIGYLFYKNFGFNVNLNTQPALNVVSSWDLTAFAQRPLVKPMSLAIFSLESAFLLILEYIKLNLNSGDGQLIYIGDETTYTSIDFSTELKGLFSDMGISIDDLNGKLLRDTYIYRYEKRWAVSENGIQFGKGVYWNLGTTKVDIYVNNGSTQDKEDGSTTYPFKTLQKAIDVLRPEINDVTIHLTKTATPYVGNFGDVISKAISIIGSAAYTPLYLSGTFYNSSLEIDAANILLDAEHNYITYGSDKVAIMYYNSSFIIKNSNNTGINHNENENEVDNNNTVGLMCAFNSTMDIRFAYINDVPFLVTGENVSIGLRIAGLTNINTLFNNNYGFDVNLLSQPPFNNINNWSITAFSSRNLAKPMVISASGIEAAMRAPLQFAKLKIKNGDAEFIYTGNEDTYDTQSLSQDYITAFTNIKGSTPTFKGRMIKGTYVYNSSAKWMVKEDGTILGKAINDNTDYRPNADYMAILKKFMYYDKSLSKPIWWNGTNWVDATGATV